MPTAAISGCPCGVLGVISTEDRIHEPMNTTQANRASTVFWMWLLALLGSATAFVESTLAQLFKLRSKDSFIGGPAYYIQQGLRKPWMAKLFAVLITVTFGLSYNSIQSNTICGAMEHAFGFNPLWVGVVLVILSLFVVFGGIHRIARVSSVLVPVMAIGYLALALVVILMNM